MFHVWALQELLSPLLRQQAQQHLPLQPLEHLPPLPLLLVAQQLPVQFPEARPHPLLLGEALLRRQPSLVRTETEAYVIGLLVELKIQCKPG